MSDQKILPQKYIKKLNEFAEGYQESVDGANTDEIKKLILTSEQNLYQIEHERDNNAGLIKMKEELKEATAPFAEAKSVETAKVRYCLWVLDSRNVKM